MNATVSLERLFEEISKISEMLQNVATDTVSIKQPTAELTITVTHM